MNHCGVICALVLAISAVGSPNSSWDFEDAEVGELPTGWSTAKTGEGEGSEWSVIEDNSAPAGARVLAQTSSAAPRPLFNLCVLEDVEFADVDLSVAFKAVSGDIDQGGGPVWRYSNANNYYIARFNPLENNFRVYKVVDGKRTQLGTADAEAAAGEWHTIRIVHRANRIRCSLNGTEYLDVGDDTFGNPGHVGLWTKADAVTSFDALTVANPE